MSNEKPLIESQLLASMIEATPNRVRKRLDKNPDAAIAWPWRQSGSSWEILAGEEIVTIALELTAKASIVIRQLDQVRCSCLLSPKCFHVLACVTALSVSDVADVAEQQPESEQEGASRGEQPSQADDGCGLEKSADHGQPDAAVAQMREAVARVRQAVTGILTVGSRGSGTLLQSGLLRAGHQCRAAALPTLGNAVLRIAEGLRRLRSQTVNADTISPA